MHLEDLDLDEEFEEFLNMLMKKYDMDRDNELDFHELRKLMLGLNEGKPVDNKEIKRIMKKADKNKNQHISLAELHLALKIWFHLRDRQSESCCCI